VTVLLKYVARDRGHYLCYQARNHLAQRIRLFAEFLIQIVDPADFEVNSTCRAQE